MASPMHGSPIDHQLSFHSTTSAMMHSSAYICMVACMLTCPQPAGARLQKDMERKHTGFIAPIKTGQLRDDLETAVEEALGHGHGVESGKLQSTRKMLLSTFRALPKNDADNIELPALRHLVHRHFMQQHGISIKAFEPHQPLNGSELSAAEVLQDRAPAYVEELLRGRFAHHGFTLKDTVAIVVTLEQLLLDDSRRRLEAALNHYQYSRPNFSMLKKDTLEFTDAVDVLQYFFLTVLGFSHPSQDDYTEETLTLATSELERVSFERKNSLIHFGLQGRDYFSFEEMARTAHAMVLAAGKLYAHCDAMRDELASRSKTGNGRVRLAEFYSGSSNSDMFWFGESKDWLRRLGALDESSFYTGPQVLIPNYIAAAPNCVLSTELYRVCCHNGECEQMMDTLERELGQSTAKPSEIQPILKTLTMQDAPMPSSLGVKLDEIADHHGGSVPLHGRLFAQVLHYAAPLECPFPHKRGTIMAQNFEECGEGCLVSEEDREAAEMGSIELDEDTTAEDAWLSQWTHEEELIADIGKKKHPVASTSSWVRFLAGGTLLSLLLWARLSSSKGAAKDGHLPCGGMGSKSHLV